MFSKILKGREALVDQGLASLLHGYCCMATDWCVCPRPRLSRRLNLHVHGTPPATHAEKRRRRRKVTVCFRETTRTASIAKPSKSGKWIKTARLVMEPNETTTTEPTTSNEAANHPGDSPLPSGNDRQPNASDGGEASSQPSSPSPLKRTSSRLSRSRTTPPPRLRRRSTTPSSLAAAVSSGGGEREGRESEAATETEQETVEEASGAESAQEGEQTRPDEETQSAPKEDQDNKGENENQGRRLVSVRCQD